MRKLALIGSMLLGACSHSGQGQGELVAPSSTAGAEPSAEGVVRFEWQSGSDESHGDLRAALPGGRVFAGEYLQLRADVQTDAMGAHLVRRPVPEWASDPWFGAEPQFLPSGTSDRVVAHLSGPDGVQMRCRFTLESAEAGMAGGGEGTCQLSDQEEVVAAALMSGR